MKVEVETCGSDTTQFIKTTLTVEISTRIGPRINHHKMTLKASNGLESNNIGSTHNRKYTQFGGSQPWSQQNSSFLSKYDTKESFLHSNVAYKVLNLNFSKKSSTTL